MGRGRAPCCAKVGLNKGSWTPEEDWRLIAYIHKHGHGNWRALPKLAGLLRCGKSCRLRWINYLRPDIKRGNFTKEEEDTIIKLHGLLGNKWSKIASCLPGRTDNEIKNVWNTHLKKRLAPKERKSPALAQQKPEEQPSSPSSITTASGSCSDEGDSKTEKEQGEGNAVADNDEEQNKAGYKEIDKIEIPIEPNLDLWDMLQDTSSLSEPPPVPPHEMTVEPCSSSDVGLKDGDPLADLPEINPIEPEIWNMIKDDFVIVATKESTTTTTTSTDQHQNSATTNFEAESSERWLQYLEKELDLWGESSTIENQQCVREACNFADIMEGGDPVASYFHALQSSPSPLDPLYSWCNDVKRVA